MKRSLDRVLDVGERLLERSEIKIVLASLIIVSVLPMPQPVWFDLTLLPIFALELALRFALLKRARRFNRDEKILLSLDFVALLTFLPIFGLIGIRLEWVRLIRLIRLIVLARFLRTTLGELRKILAQRQIRYQFGFLFATVVLLTFLGGSILTVLKTRIDFDNSGQPEDGGIFKVLWWVFRQIEDPGNLVEDPHGDAVLLLTSLALTISGVFVMSFIIGIGTSVVGALMDAARHRRVPLRDHTVVIGGGRNVRKVLEDLVGMYAKNRRRVRVAVLDEAELPPQYLEDRAYRGVEYRAGEPTSLEAHEILSTDAARRVVVLSNDELGESADAYVISTVLAVRQQNSSCPITLEMRHRRYMDMAIVAGGQNIKPLPMGKFLGCLMSQSMMFPGIDAVFEELLSARGSEIYTHIYTPAELRDLCEGDSCVVCFKTLLLHCFSRHHIILLGVLLGDGEWTYDVSELSVWLNPLDEPSPAARALGARAGEIPLEALRGVVAVAREYSTVHAAAGDVHRAVVAAECTADDADEHELHELHEPLEKSDGLTVSLASDMLQLKRILVFGDNELLPALVENTANFVEEVEFTIVTQSLERRDQVADELRRRSGRTGRTIGEKAERHHVFPLARGGEAIIIGSQGDVLADALERPSVRRDVFDAAVLLTNPQEIDPDANTALMLLRILELVQHQRLRVGPKFRVITEVVSGPKGNLLEKRLDRAAAAMVRIISTQQMRSYFLVHSAYVPGSDKVHLELLSADHQDFCQFQMEHGDDVDQELSFGDLMSGLVDHRPPVICFGIKLGHRHATPGLVLNPQGDDSDIRFKTTEIEAVYAVGETLRFSKTTGDED